MWLLKNSWRAAIGRFSEVQLTLLCSSKMRSWRKEYRYWWSKGLFIQGFQVFSFFAFEKVICSPIGDGKIWKILWMFSGSFYILCGRHIHVSKPYKNCSAIANNSYRDKVLENALLLLWLSYVAVPRGGRRFELSIYTVLCGLLLLLCCLHWFLPPFILYCSLKVGFNWLPTGLAWLLLLVKKKTSVFAGKSLWIEDFFICILSIF